jgi:hypothetical protein
VQAMRGHDPGNPAPDDRDPHRGRTRARRQARLGAKQGSGEPRRSIVSEA